MLAVLPAPADLEREAIALLRQWRVPHTAVRVQWNPRLRTSAGRAWHQQGRIELNPHLLLRAPRLLHTVLVHETAHLAASRLFGPRTAAHGRHWRALMRLAGLPPDPTHDIPVARRRRRRFAYLRLCDACGARRIGRSVRYGACGCGAADRFLVMRAPAGAAGLAALRGLSLSAVRAQCIMGGP
ncbi:MAG TPA: SprT-like domain-containing protein [Planctomycetota bacterium]|nr:SprT-like domain-containing protein [Planctomycetota bacterium]